MTKEETLKRLPEKSFSKAEVAHLIRGITQLDISETPQEIKMGDVIAVQQGVKRRPCLVISVRKSFVFYASLSSTENEYNLIKGSSRFFGGSYINKQVSICTLDYARNNFLGVYGNRTVVREAKKEIKKFYKGILF